MSEGSVIDFAALDASAAAATTAADTTTTTEGTEAEPEVSTETTESGTENTEGGEKNADGTPKEKAEALPGNEATPQNIRQALKSLRDADPKNAAVVKELHGAFERWNAAKAVFPKGVAEMKEAKAFIDTVGGHEGFEKLQETVSAINASDEMLYAGDPKLIDNIVEDLKGSGNLAALGKIAPAFLDALKTNDQAAYYSVFAPHFLAGLQQVELPEVLEGINAALAKGGEAGLAEAKKIAAGSIAWYKDLQAKAEKSKADAVSPERLKLEEERKAFQKQQEEFKTNQTTEFKNGVAREQEKFNNTQLGSDLKDYLKMPFFKGFSRENLMPLGNEIKRSFFDTLKADKNYQAQMKALWAAKDPDRARIISYHKQKLEQVSADVVRNAVQKMYPGYAKGGIAAGRAAAADAKKSADAKATATSIATGKPVYVAVKPKWEEIDWTKDPKQLNYIGGKAYLKASGKLVTWRK